MRIVHWLKSYWISVLNFKAAKACCHWYIQYRLYCCEKVQTTKIGHSLLKKELLTSLLEKPIILYMNRYLKIMKVGLLLSWELIQLKHEKRLLPHLFHNLFNDIIYYLCCIWNSYMCLKNLYTAFTFALYRRYHQCNWTMLICSTNKQNNNNDKMIIVTLHSPLVKKIPPLCSIK